MGYTTYFEGRLTFDRALTPDQCKYIQNFSNSRRMKRNVEKLQELFGGQYGLNGNYGNEGEYFANPGDNHGQTNDSSIVDYNTPPGQLDFSIDDFSTIYEKNKQLIKDGGCQPGLWCQWTVSNDGAYLEWNGGEKFYHYIEWLKYLIAHFFGPWGYKLNGNIKWDGEDSDDKGIIIVVDNVVTTKKAKIIYE